MSSSIFIRLAGPLQSWAGPSVSGNFVRTQQIPTLTGLQGLLAGALGAQRNEIPAWITNVRFTVREDSTSMYVDDYQIIGSREDEWFYRQRMDSILHGTKPRPVNKLYFKPSTNDHQNSVVRRIYLANAEFIVRVTDELHTEEIDHAMSSPTFANYLGRKAFPAVFPFYLGTGDSDLLERIPTIRSRPADGNNERKVVRIYELDPSLEPLTTAVPAVSTRKQWLEKLLELSLHRRATIVA